MNDESKGNRWIDPRFDLLTVTERPPFVKLGDGSILAVRGNATVVSRDTGKTWSDPRPIYRVSGSETVESGPGIPSNSGRLVRTREGVLILVWMDKRVLNWDSAVGEPGLDAHGDVWSIRSFDEGKTWVDRQLVYTGIAAHPTINLVETDDGNIVAAVQLYLRQPGRNVVQPHTSDDQGATWRARNIIDLGGHGHHDGAFEPTFVQLRDGRLWMLIRTNWDRFWEAYSEDSGRSWRLIRPSQITSSTSPGYITRLNSGRLAFVWNQLYPEGQDAFPRRSEQYSEAMASWHREELSIAFSENEGQSWTQPVIVTREKDTWISYPYLFEVEVGKLWLFTGQGDLRVSFYESELLRTID